MSGRGDRLHAARYATLIVVLLLAFWLRVHNLAVPNLNIDEAWSFLHTFNLVFSTDTSPTQVLRVEPNNALHLIAASALVRFVPTAFGLRFLSVAASLVSVALTARLAFRLFGSRAVLPAALLTAFAFAPVVFAHIGRPYALATALALASLAAWLERRWRLNMLFSALVPLAHIGAMPIVITQDIMTLWRLARGQRVNRAQWVISRVVTYSMLALMLLLVVIRRFGGKITSEGQTVPTLNDLFAHLVNLLHGPSPDSAITLTHAWHETLFVLGVLLPVAGLFLLRLYRRRRLAGVGLLLLWIGVTYAILVALALWSEGSIKLLHISHIAFALILLIASVLAAVRPALRWIILVLFCATSAVSLHERFSSPYLDFSETEQQLNALREPDEAIYLHHFSALWALQLNVPTASYLHILPVDPDERPRAYRYLGYQDWEPPTPPECDTTPLWTFNLFHLHMCQR